MYVGDSFYRDFAAYNLYNQFIQLAVILYFTGDLVKELKSADDEMLQATVDKADAYLQSAETIGFDLTLVNTSTKNESITDPQCPVCFIRINARFYF